jgi:hypothetical protein
VRDFALPDLPNAKTMLYYSTDNLNDRYSDQTEIDSDSATYAQSLALADRHFQLAHRHKISLFDDYSKDMLSFNQGVV